MPFRSRKQARWAFANKKPFAKRWAKETPSFAALPETKDAGTAAGAPLRGPGGLLAMPGMGRLRKRLKMALKAQSAEDKAMFAKMGGDSSGGGGSSGGTSKLWPKGPSGKRTPQAAVAQGGKPDTKPAKDNLPARPAKGETIRTEAGAEKIPVMIRTTSDGTTHYSIGSRITSDRAKAERWIKEHDRDAPQQRKVREAGEVRQRAEASKRETTARERAEVKKRDFDRHAARDRIVELRKQIEAGDGSARTQQALTRAQQKYDATQTKSFTVITTKPMTRSEAASVAAHARWDKTPRKAKPPLKGRKPARTDAERATARQQAQGERDTARQTKRTQNRADVLRSLNIAPDGQAALEALRNGEAPDPAALARGGFVEAGLVERARDGTYRMTPAGRALLSAADAGDRGRAGDTISGGRDRVGARTQRQADAVARKKQPKQAGGGSKKKEPPKLAAPRPLTRAERRRKRKIAQLMQRPKQTLKAQTAENRAMFAKMGGGGKGGSGGGGALWNRDPATGKRAPNQTQVDRMREHEGALFREANETYSKIRKLRDEQEATHPSWGQKLKPKYEKERQSKRDQLEGEIKALRAKHDELNRQTEQATRQRRKYEDQLKKRSKSFLVYKSHDGTPRWLARTTTAYRDRDREIITVKALDADSQRMAAAGQFGPLRLWHVGYPDPLNAQTPWGPGLDVGDCDFSTQIGTTRVESGTFRDPAIAARIAATADQYELSPGFFHPPDQPSADGVFTAIRTFERSLVPTKYGRASNLFTGLTVKGVRMEPTEMERRFKAVIEQLRLSPEQAESLSAGLIQADKSAQQQGIAYKSDDQVSLVINGVVYKAETPEPTPEPHPDVVINGVTYKALPPEFLDEQKDDTPGEAEGAEAMGEYADDMGMDDAALIAAIADAVSAKIAPMFGDMKLSEFKALMGGMSQKDASRATEIAALKAEQAKLAERLTQLTGDQPAVVLPADVEAALKGAPASPPDPNAPQIPNDPARPFAPLAAAALPQLYGGTVQGYTPQNGWQITPPPPANTGGN